MKTLQRIYPFQSKEAYYTKPPFSGLNGALHFNTCVHGLEELLRYADRNSMAQWMRSTSAFLDHSLVEFIFSLPADLKIKQGWTKWILRKASSRKVIFRNCMEKNKVGFEPPQQQWMQNKNSAGTGT